MCQSFLKQSPFHAFHSTFSLPLVMIEVVCLTGPVLCFQQYLALHWGQLFLSHLRKCWHCWNSWVTGYYIENKAEFPSSLRWRHEFNCCWYKCVFVWLKCCSCYHWIAQPSKAGAGLDYILAHTLLPSLCCLKHCSLPLARSIVPIHVESHQASFSPQF